MAVVGPRVMNFDNYDDEPHSAPQRLSRSELTGIVDEIRICARDASTIGDMDSCGKLRRIAYRLERGLLT